MRQGFSACNAPRAPASPPVSVLCSAARLCRLSACMLEQMRPWKAFIHHACPAHQQLCINQLLELQAMPCSSVPALRRFPPVRPPRSSADGTASRHCWKLPLGTTTLVGTPGPRQRPSKQGRRPACRSATPGDPRCDAAAARRHKGGQQPVWSHLLAFIRSIRSCQAA